MQPFSLGRLVDGGELVSILTRPGGRVQLELAVALPMPRNCFNPHPTRRPGATTVGKTAPAVNVVFQSSPDPEAGCNTVDRSAVDDAAIVSILTRPGGRVQQSMG